MLSKFYQETGDAYIIWGYPGFVVLWVAVNKNFLATMVATALFGWFVAGLLLHNLQEATSLFILAVAGVELLLIHTWLIWKLFKKKGILRPIPKWPNWRR
jgi:hypothetical protein